MSTTQPAYVKFGGTAPENYERYFVPVIGGVLAETLVDDAGLRAGERVLDVACGTGVVARKAAQRVGPEGTVAGLDANAGMLAVARSQPPAGAPIRWYETSAESMPLPDAAFDVVFCQLGLQFMQNQPAALREMRRVLAPGGRLYANTPQPSAFFAVLDDVMARHVGAEAAGFVRLVFSLNDVTRIERLLTDAGFRDIDIRVDTVTLRLPPPVEFFWQYVLSTPLADSLMSLDSTTVSAIEQDISAGWADWSTPEGMAAEQNVIVTAARAA